MPSLKLLKLPKKPKQSASASVLERFLAKVRELKKINQQRQALNKKYESLKKQVAGIGATDVIPNRVSVFSRPKAKSKSKSKQLAMFGTRKRKATKTKRTTRRR